MSKLYGKTLRVNLSRKKIRTESSEQFAKRFIGGRGINQWILFRELDPNTSWEDPENLLVFGSGALLGTSVPGASRMSIDTKNAFNNGVGSSNVGGHFPTEMRRAGFDHIIVSGRAEKPVYLWIHDGKAEIKDASSLWGKTTWKTEEIIREENNNKKIKVSSIGPAGENLVKGSAIINDKFKAAGGSGVGAVMGAKNLKAIATWGGRVIWDEPEKFRTIVKNFRSRIKKSEFAKNIREKGFFGSSSSLESGYKAIEWGYRPVRNHQDLYWDPEKLEKTGAKKFEKYIEGTFGCSNCPHPCMPRVVVKKGKYATEGGGFWNNHHNSFCTQFDNDNLEAAIFATQLCNKLGLDTDNAAKVIAWAFECYEKDIFSKEDTGGLELAWGNEEAMIKMLEKLAYREGIGDLLAEGAKRSAEVTKNGSERFSVHIKGQDALDGVRISKGWGFGIVTSPCGGRHLRGAANSEPVNSYKGVPKRVFKREQYKAVLDMLGICAYVPRQSLEIFSELTTIGTDQKYSPEKLLSVGRQVHNIEKAFNTLHAGFTREDDFPVKRCMDDRVKSGPYKGERLDRGIWNKMLDRYYTLHGWKKDNSWQTKECLEELNLEKVANKLDNFDKLEKFSKDEKINYKIAPDKNIKVPYRWC